MTFDVLLIAVAGTLVVLGLTARLAKQFTLSPFLLAVVIGTVLGPYVLGVVDLTAGDVDRSTVLEQTSRIALALSVTSIGFRVQRSDLRANGRRVVSLLTVGMIVMWLVSAVGARLVLGLPWSLSLLLGAVLTPTDPATVSALVQGALAEQLLPQRLRMTLDMESGANDGLTIVFVLVAGALLPHSGIDGAGQLFVEVAREIGVAVVVGPAIGVAAGYLMRFARAREAIEESFLPILVPATSLLVLGVCGSLNSSGVLAALLAGAGVSWTARDPDAERAVATAQENFTKVATTVFFLAFGATLPWAAWRTLGASGVVFALWVVLLRRPAAGVVALAPTRTGRWSTAFLSWFGPLGVASVYYATYVRRFELAHQDRFFATVSLAVAVSMVVHTFTGTPGMHLYRRVVDVDAVTSDSPSDARPLP